VSRAQHASVASDISTLSRGISALSSFSPSPVDCASNGGGASPAAGVCAVAARGAVSHLVEQINTLKRKVDEGRRAELAGINACRSRISALQAEQAAAGNATGHSGAADGSRAMHCCDRLVADYLLRMGLHGTAGALCASFDRTEQGLGVGAATADAGAAASEACYHDYINIYTARQGAPLRPTASLPITPTASLPIINVSITPSGARRPI